MQIPFTFGDNTQELLNETKPEKVTVFNSNPNEYENGIDYDVLPPLYSVEEITIEQFINIMGGSKNEI